MARKGSFWELLRQYLLPSDKDQKLKYELRFLNKPKIKNIAKNLYLSSL